MAKTLYLAIVVHMIAFALCVVAFITTSDIFQYLIGIFNLVLLFNALRIAVEMEL